jgi:hypothetical protein
MGLAVVVVLNAALLTFVAFFKGYGSKKGENLATHEDIQMLVKQVEAVTKAAKEIEATISTKAWARDVRKETVFEVLARLATVDACVTSLVAFYNEHAGHAHTEDLAQQSLHSKFEIAYAEYVKARMLAGVVCGREVREALVRIQKALRAIVSSCMEEMVVAATRALDDLIEEITLLGELVRKDLGIEL